MASQRNPLFGVEVNITHTFRSDDLLWLAQMILDHLAGPTNQRMERLEEDMRQVKTLLREFREGLDALRADEASDDARDAENALTIEQKDARIAELETLKAELEARPSMSQAERDTWDAMVVELGELTGNVITDDEDEGETEEPVTS